MSISVSRSLAYVEQGRSTCNVSRFLSSELFCFAVCVCHVCLFRFLARSLKSSKDDRPAMSVALSPSSFFASQRVSVMYVCFSLARSLSSSKDGRPAMSIALSPSGFFALQRVSVSAPNRRELSRLLANSLAKSIKKHSENRPKIDPRRRPGATKIDSKSLLGPSRETPWRARASRRRLRSVPGASRSVPGALRECPKGRQGRPGTPEMTPWSARERAEATKIDAKSRPGAEKSSFLRAAHSQSIVGAIFRRFLSIFAFSAKSANP